MTREPRRRTFDNKDILINVPKLPLIEGVPDEDDVQNLLRTCLGPGKALCLRFSFSIATDTAGSGRIPAALNGIVGCKPTRGLLSTTGLVPACLSLDCIALIARTISDARLIWQLQKIGSVLTPIDWSPFSKAGKLLYEGTFVSERMASLPNDFMEKNGDHLHPVIRDLFEQVQARNSTAVQAYRDLQAKALYTRKAEEVLGYSAQGVDVVIVPTTVTHWTIKEMLADPIRRNSALGDLTHCGNVLDLYVVAVPAGEYSIAELTGNEEDTGGLPFGISFLGFARMDAETLELAKRFEESRTK
ncbi:amidase signature enzyme [Venturia nashicola]|nr:amidase signature enzyme [Venturia nashicola]